MKTYPFPYLLCFVNSAFAFSLVYNLIYSDSVIHHQNSKVFPHHIDQTISNIDFCLLFVDVFIVQLCWKKRNHRPRKLITLHLGCALIRCLDYDLQRVHPIVIETPNWIQVLSSAFEIEILKLGNQAN